MDQTLFTQAFRLLSPEEQSGFAQRLLSDNTSATQELRALLIEAMIDPTLKPSTRGAP